MIKILLADGHNVVRNGIRSLLEKESDIEVVAEATKSEELLQLLKHDHRPNIVFIAINLPQTTEIDLIAKIRHGHPAIKVIVLSSIDDEKYILQAFKAGATGYMLKSINSVELIYGIRHVYNSNERYLCNEVALRLLDNLIHTPENTFDVDASEIEISKREIEVLSLISHGFTNQEVADKLFTSKRTIESHRQNLIEKTGTRNTAALIRYAVLNSIIR